MLMKVLHPALLILLQGITRPFDFEQTISATMRKVHQVWKAAAVIAQITQYAFEYREPVLKVDSFERESDDIQVDTLPVNERVQ